MTKRMKKQLQKDQDRRRKARMQDESLFDRTRYRLMLTFGSMGGLATVVLSIGLMSAGVI